MKKGGSDRLREKCAVVGVSTKGSENEAAQISYQALFAMQHRGVEGSGIVTTDGGPLVAVREPGMVRDVYSDADIARLQGSIAVGHNRYSTSGDRHSHLQPVISESIGFALAHNGNIPDTDPLEDYLSKRRYIPSQYNDSELLGQSLASKLHGGRDFETAMREVSELAVGAYACVATHDGILAGFRDPHGIRPLEIGRFDNGLMLASETSALDTVGAEHLRSVKPGELVLIHDGEVVSTSQFAEGSEHFDAFELVYFARHDSVMKGERVNEIRRRFGEELAILHPPWQETHEDIVVMAVPDTSVPAAEAYARTLGLPYESGIIKNRYIGRTFMQPTQASRQNNLRLKHTMIPERIKGRHIYLIDDSIVRGNTLPRLVQLAYQLGAKSVTVLIASPPIRFSDHYGVDTPEQSSLMAAQMTVEEMRREISRQSEHELSYLGFLTKSALVRATRIPENELNLSAFTGEYPVSIGKRALELSTPVSMEYID